MDIDQTSKPAKPKRTQSDRERYRMHKVNSKRRGVGFRLTFEEWISWWEATGHYAERGNRRGQYVMGRIQDSGAYQLGNIECVQAQLNSTTPHTGALRSEVTKQRMRDGLRTARATKGVPKKSKQKRNFDGRRQHPLYEIWKGIVHRCSNPKNHAYDLYGGRGITICAEWMNDYWSFVRDMEPRPQGASVDRIDNNGSYCKANCRWACPKEQTRNSRLRKYDDLPTEAPALSEYALRLGISRQGALHRVRKFGWKDAWNGTGASQRHPLPIGFKEDL